MTAAPDAAMFTALYNALLLALWLRIVPVDAGEAVGNPLVAPALNRVDGAADLLRPAFGPRASRRLAAFVFLAFALVLRGLAAHAAGGGLSLVAGPAAFVPRAESASSCIVFSALSFGWLVQRTWLVTLAFAFLRRRREPTMADGLAEALGEPVSRTSFAARLALALALATALAVATIRAASPVPAGAALAAAAAQAEGQGAETLRVAAHAATTLLPDFRSPTGAAVGLVVAGSVAGVFSVANDLVFAAIMLQIAGMLLRWPYAVALGASGLEYTVGSVFRNPMRTAGMSLAPLAFLLVGTLAYTLAFQLGTVLVLALSGSLRADTLHALWSELSAAAAATAP